MKRPMMTLGSVRENSRLGMAVPRAAKWTLSSCT